MFSIPFLFPTISLAFADKTGPQVTDIDRIRDTLECRLFTFSPYVQRHYALRMYRITGDDKYLNPIITDMMVLAQLLRQDIEGLGDEDYRRARTQLILERFDLNKPKQQRRYELLSRSGHLAFDLALLANLNMLHEVNLLDTAFFPDTSKALVYLRERDFADFFLADDVVRIYSPQLATYVFFLYDLGIADLRKPFIAAFRRVFPDQLHSGPDLRNSPVYQRFWLRNYLP